MFNVNRRQIAGFIISGFLFIEWTFLASRVAPTIPLEPNLPLSNQQDTQQQQQQQHSVADERVNVIGKRVAVAPAAVIQANNASNKTSAARQQQKQRQQKPQLYQLIGDYSKDQLLPNLLAKDDPPFKRILFWNTFKREKNYGVGLGRDALRQWGCPVWQCQTSDNRTDVHHYDAVVFHQRTWNRKDLPKRRSPHQRYVFFSLESPAWPGYRVARMARFFNWTMTYRWDSDMIYPYGYIAPTGDVPLHPSQDQMQQLFLSSDYTKVNFAQGKTKMAAWFVSNCHTVVSSRNEMVKELQRYIKVDVYGKCGNLKCRKKLGEDSSSDECRDMVANNYKFYLALENSLCRDYVTEKFFDNMRRPILPVVFGLHDDHEKLAPPHSFINGAKFKNMKALADYLILLDKNDTLYNEYFWWKPHFRVRDSQRDKNQAMCHLCAALHDPTRPPKIYANLADWWETQSKCIFSPVIS